MYSWCNFPYNQSKISFEKHWNPHASQFYSMVLNDKTMHWGYRDLTITRISINDTNNCEICSGKNKWMNHLNKMKWQGFEWGICQIEHNQKLMDTIPTLNLSNISSIATNDKTESNTQPMDVTLNLNNISSNGTNDKTESNTQPMDVTLNLNNISSNGTDDKTESNTQPMDVTSIGTNDNTESNTQPMDVIINLNNISSIATKDKSVEDSLLFTQPKDKDMSI